MDAQKGPVVERVCTHSGSASETPWPVVKWQPWLGKKDLTTALKTDGGGKQAPGSLEQVRPSESRLEGGAALAGAVEMAPTRLGTQ